MQSYRAIKNQEGIPNYQAIKNQVGIPGYQINKSVQKNHRKNFHGGSSPLILTVDRTDAWFTPSPYSPHFFKLSIARSICSCANLSASSPSPARSASRIAECSLLEASALPSPASETRRTRST